jgi:hypothetical protein
MESPNVNCSAIATYQYSFNWWSSRVTPIPTSPVVKSTETAVGVTSGATPLYVIEPFFSIRLLAQSNPLVSISNSLTITLNSNCELSIGSTITISGLVDTQTGDPPAIVGSSAIFATPATSWTQGTGEIVITATEIVSSFVNYTIQFWIQNPTSPQSSPQINVSAVIPSEARIPEGLYGYSASEDFPSWVSAVEVQKSNETAVGVASGETPLFVIVPVLPTKWMDQRFVMLSATNPITVTITANCDIRPGSTVTLTELTGTDTDVTDLHIIKAMYDTTAHEILETDSWDPASGQLVMNVIGDGMLFDTPVIFTFWVKNGGTEQTTPGPSAEATIKSESEVFTFTSPLSSDNFDMPDDTLYFYQPLHLMNNPITGRNVSQNNPLTMGSNMITVEIYSVADLLIDSTITLVGLTGLDSSGDIKAADGNSAHSYFGMARLLQHSFGNVVAHGCLLVPLAT